MGLGLLGLGPICAQRCVNGLNVDAGFDCCGRPGEIALPICGKRNRDALSRRVGVRVCVGVCVCVFSSSISI